MVRFTSHRYVIPLENRVKEFALLEYFYQGETASVCTQREDMSLETGTTATQLEAAVAKLAAKPGDTIIVLYDRVWRGLTGKKTVPDVSGWVYAGAGVANPDAVSKMAAMATSANRRTEQFIEMCDFKLKDEDELLASFYEVKKQMNITRAYYSPAVKRLHFYNGYGAVFVSLNRCCDGGDVLADLDDGVMMDLDCPQEELDQQFEAWKEAGRPCAPILKWLA